MGDVSPKTRCQCFVGPWDELPAQRGHLLSCDKRTYVRRVDQYELEILRRSIGMLQVGAPALDREKAMVLVRELQSLEHELRSLRGGLQRLLDESANEPDVKG